MTAETARPSVAVDLIIPGTPVPKGRPRVYKGHGVTPKRTRAAEQRIRDTFQQEYPDFTPLKDRLIVSCEFWMHSAGRPDADNCIKLVTDALNGVAYEDDEQIDLLTARRYLPDRRVYNEHTRTWRYRRGTDPHTYYGIPYEPHTRISIYPIYDDQYGAAEWRLDHRKKRTNP